MRSQGEEEGLWGCWCRLSEMK